jgi:DNA invertase Pin-like site-specific DNA recombinase
MKVHYVRVSSLVGQNTDRQKVDVEADLILEDKCSGSIPLFERPAGSKLKELVEKGEVSCLSVHHPDRVCRNTISFLQTIEYFNFKKVNIVFTSLGLQTLDDDGKENTISKMVLSFLGVLADVERRIIKERVLEGIAVAKSKGVYLGRKKNTTEDSLTFLSKPKNQKVIEYLRKGYKQTEIYRITGVSPNTIIKVRKLLKNDQNGKSESEIPQASGGNTPKIGTSQTRTKRTLQKV